MSGGTVRHLSRRESYPAIDVFRIIAAAIVVAGHTYPLGDYGGGAGRSAVYLLERIIHARIAIPFFFATSGFFLFRDGAPSRAALVRFVKNTLRMYILATALYLPVLVYNGNISVWSNTLAFARDLLLDGTFYHLWYLPASALGAAIVWFLMRRTGLKGALIICAALFLFGVFGDNWYSLSARVPALTAVYGAWFKVSEYTRNGLFFAPLFFALGAAVRTAPKFSRRYDILFFALTFVLLVAEGFLKRAAVDASHGSMYLGQPLCAFALMRLLTAFGGKTRSGMRGLSTAVYILHPLVIVFVRGAAEAVNAEKIFIDDSLGHFAAVAAGSFALAAVWLAVWKRLRPRVTYGLPEPRAWTEINLSRLRGNVGAARSALPEGCRITAVVKADAYGHGAAETARTLEACGVTDFAVATLSEGVALRKSGTRGNILILGYTPRSSARMLRRYRLEQTAVDAAHAEELDSAGAKLRVQLKIDTGMHRLGEDASNVGGIASVFALKNLTVTGIYTHLATSDARSGDGADFARTQVERFAALDAALKRRGTTVPKTHLQASYGVLNYIIAGADFARLGVALYGVLSSPESVTGAVKYPMKLSPVLSLRSRVILVRELKAGERAGYGLDFTARRDSRVAVVSVGYADGVPRSLSNRGCALIRGVRAQIAGRVCMDCLTLDVTDLPEVSRGDVVTLIGRDGDERISAEEAAEAAGTITNELLSRLSDRLERVVIEG
ncbi:MAG: serine racemase VanT catalytic subunit [Oscillospiraceae bacterium]|jgi:serine/alanine racemase|nr:serine racemase VanT catalytic subunit [Oscillospiraceae bacterium]